MKRRGFLQRVFGGIGVLSLARVLPTVPAPAVVVAPVPVVLTPDPFSEMARTHAMTQTCCSFVFEPIEVTAFGDANKVYVQGVRRRYPSDKRVASDSTLPTPGQRGKRKS